MTSTVYPVQVAQNHSTIAVLTRPFKQHPVVVAELELVSAEVEKRFLSVYEDNEQEKPPLQQIPVVQIPTVSDFGIFRVAVPLVHYIRKCLIMLTDLLF